MKKFLSILFAVIMMFSAVSCLSVGAVSDSTTDEAADVAENSNLDPDIYLQVKKDAYENYYNGEKDFDDIIVTVFGALKDGSLLVNVTTYDAGHIDAIYTDTIGDYYYVYSPSDIAYIYRDHDFYNIFSAYDDGLIDDSILEEFCEISKEYSGHPYNDCYFYFYPKTGESGLDYLVESEIKYEAYVNLFGHNIFDEPIDFSNIIVTHFGTLSDGSLVVNVDERDAAHLDVVSTETLGNYSYIEYDSSQCAYIYKDSKLYYIVDAYNSGMLNDDVLDELYAISVEYSRHPRNDKSFVLSPLADDSTTPTTQPETTISKNNTPTTSGDLKSSTSDTPATKTPATSDTATNKNSNGAVQTGQNNLIVSIAMLLVVLAALSAVIVKLRYRNN